MSTCLGALLCSLAIGAMVGCTNSSAAFDAPIVEDTVDPEERAQALPQMSRALPASAVLDHARDPLRLVASHGNTSAPNAAVLVEADRPIDPDSLPLWRCEVRHAQQLLAIDFAYVAPRWIVIRPRSLWLAGEVHEVHIRGVGLHGASVSVELTATFQVGNYADAAAPECEARILGLDPESARALRLAPDGLSIELTSAEVLDPSRTAVRILAPLDWNGVRTNARTVLPTWLTGNAEELRFEPPRDVHLKRGRVRIAVEAVDLAGNVAEPLILKVRVAPLRERARPFAEPQIIWIDFASDRTPLGEANGIADWIEDLRRFGLTSAHDPLGIEEDIADELADRSLSHARYLLRAATEEDLILRRTDAGAPSSARLCVGGGDPTLPRRTIAERSSGLLGRAPFDARNQTKNEQVCRLAPALGVFPGELFQSEARRALDLGTSGSTAFTQLFADLAPELGGIAFGLHALDARLLDPRFDPEHATQEELRRWHCIEDASSALSHAVGALIAHELGHLVGLVEPASLPRGLHGTPGYHGATEGLMAPALQFEALMDEALHLDPLEAAYLSERMSLR